MKKISVWMCAAVVFATGFSAFAAVESSEVKERAAKFQACEWSFKPNVTGDPGQASFGPLGYNPRTQSFEGMNHDVYMKIDSVVGTMWSYDYMTKGYSTNNDLRIFDTANSRGIVLDEHTSAGDLNLYCWYMTN